MGVRLKFIFFSSKSTLVMFPKIADVSNVIANYLYYAGTVLEKTFLEKRVE